MDSSVSGKDEIWFLRVCHHVPHELYHCRERHTCFSDNRRQDAISILRRRDKYMFAANSLSSSKSCVLVKAVRIRLHEPPLLVFWRSITGLGLRLVVAPPLIGEHGVI